jgi:hypothetical protein
MLSVTKEEKEGSSGWEDTIKRDLKDRLEDVD